ncbi:MAG: hypothetical protein K9L28_03065 [Synergistales bacterium]|nr:hypothetical protein [Synergistales bacterium]
MRSYVHGVPRFLPAVVVVVAVLMLSAGAFAAEKVLTVPYPEDPQTADCQKTTSCYTLPLNCFDRLLECVTVKPGESRLEPGLAESWEISDDGKTYTFHLREGVLFHNGEELTADDVVYTFDRMLNPRTKALNTGILDFVEGAKARLDGEAESTKGLKALDRYTVQIELSKPYAPFLAVMASPQSSIFNREFTEAAGQRFGLTPETTCGTGPFILKEYALNDRQVLTANEEYYKGPPEIDRLVIKVVSDAETMRMLFEAGQIDVFDCDYAISQIPYFTQSKKWKDNIVSGPRVGIYYISLNQRKKPFDDVRVRKAFQMAIDRELILEKMFYGRGVLANGVMPRGLVGYNPDLAALEYNPEKARTLLAEAGYPDGADMTIVQVSGWSQKWVKINEIIQAMVKDAGFRLDIRQVDESTYYATRKTGDVGPYTQVWSADFNDPDNFFYTFFGRRGTVVRSFNNHSPEVFDAIDRARAMTDQQERIALYRSLEKKIVHEQAAWVPLFTLDHVYVVRDKVKRFEVPWNGWSDMSYYPMDVQ